MKAACELKTEFCKGEAVRKYTGTKKRDPKFDACLACVAMLRRSGVKVRQVTK